MNTRSRTSSVRALAGFAAAFGLAVSGLVGAAVTPAVAAPATHLIIDEAYLNGGSAGATYLNKFVQVSNPTGQAFDVEGWSLQYRAYNSTSAASSVIPLGQHSIPPGGTLLVSGNANSTNGAALPTADVESNVAFSGNTNGGQLILARTTAAVSGDRATVLANANVVDVLGYGAATTFEGSPKVGGYSVTSSLNRTGGSDTDDNSVDFTGATPTPTACGTACDKTGGPVDPGEPGDVIPIADVQGTGATSPVANTTVTTTGVVTATYPTGGFDGAYIQTAGSGDVDLATHRASTGLFVASQAFADAVEIGDNVRLTGRVTENFGMTQIAPAAGAWTILDEPAAAVKPAQVAFPLTEAQRESLEGMLLAPQGDYTVTNNFATNQFGEVGLASGTTPLPQPTDVVRPRTQAYTDLVAENLERLVTLDDGAGVNFLQSSKDVPLPWLSGSNEVRTGAPATFVEPMVLDYRFSLWRLQPTERLVGTEGAPVTFGSTRVAAPKDVEGDLKVGSFNVLNYFPTTGQQYVAAGGSCTYFRDRGNVPITNDECSNNGPRGAATSESLARQQVKIVKAINTLDADVVSIQEIENSANLGKPRDAALNTLVAALNAAAGSDVWSAAPSPSVVPTTGTDIIRTAFIYKNATVELGSVARILDDAAFSNARAPLAQEFRPKGETDQDFLVIANHFKSKSVSAGEGNADVGDGQSGSNGSRVRQAEALVAFADSLGTEAGTDRVFLAGDFNSYAMEDPLEVFKDAGYTNLTEEFSGKDGYQFQGRHGSLDHVFGSPAATERVRDADVWQINAPEAIAREYSRFNYNVTNLYDESPFRSSDHDPAIVGFDPGPATSTVTADVRRTQRLGSTFEIGVEVASTREGVSPTGAVTVTRGETELASGTLADGAVTLQVDSADLGVGTHDLQVRYAGDDEAKAATTTVQVVVLKAVAALEVSSSGAVYGKAATIEVSADRPVTGLVYAALGTRVVGIGSIAEGEGTITLGATALEPGTHDLRVYFAGDASSDPVDAALQHTVAKAPTQTFAASPTGKVVAKQTQARIPVRIAAEGFVPSGGTVEVRFGNTVLGTGTVGTNGRASVVLRPIGSAGTRQLDVVYLGDARTETSRTTVTVKAVTR